MPGELLKVPYSYSSQQQLENDRTQQNGTPLCVQNLTSQHPMEQTPHLSTNEPRPPRRGARHTSDTHSPSVHRPTSGPPSFAVGEPANQHHGSSLGWTQPPTQQASFALDLPGSHAYFNQGFVLSGMQNDSVSPNFFDVEDIHAPHHVEAASLGRAVLLPSSSSCDTLPEARLFATDEGICSSSSDVQGFWDDPSFSGAAEFSPAGQHVEAEEAVDDTAVQPDHGTLSSPARRHADTAALVHQPPQPVQRRNNQSQKIRRKSSLRPDGAAAKQRAASRPSREQVPSDTWDTYKPAIRELYLEERKPLKEVIYIMKERHGFEATPKMYKTRFSQWGFVKNNTEDEVRRLLSMKFERDAKGKVSEFIRNGKVVNLATYLKRKGVTEYDLVDFETMPQLPSHVRCRTPSPPPPAPGYMRSPDLVRAQEILVGNMRKALVHCQQNEFNTPRQHGWTSLLLWGAGSSDMLYEAGKLFEASQNARAGSLLMRAFQHLEVDLRQLSTQGTKELLFGMSHRNPGMMTALSKYLAAYSTTNFERLHPLRIIFANLYEIQQKHGSDALSDLVWSALPTLAEEIEAIHGSNSPVAVRTWIDLSMLYNHTNTYRLANLYTELEPLNHNHDTASEEDMAFRYARLQLAASADLSGITHREQLAELWNFCVVNKLIFGIRGQPEHYCYHPVLHVEPWMKRVRQRYMETVKHTQMALNCTMMCCFPEEPHPMEHVDESDPPEDHRLLKVPISLSDMQPMPSPATGEGFSSPAF